MAVLLVMGGCASFFIPRVDDLTLISFEPANLDNLPPGLRYRPQEHMLELKFATSRNLVRLRERTTSTVFMLIWDCFDDEISSRRRKPETPVTRHVYLNGKDVYLDYGSSEDKAPEDLALPEAEGYPGKIVYSVYFSREDLKAITRRNVVERNADYFCVRLKGGVMLGGTLRSKTLRIPLPNS
jgi:hypothetical protein